MTRTRSMAVVLAALALPLTARAARPMPGDPTEGRNPLDESVRPLADLNLRPDFDLTRDQKTKVNDVRTDYAVALNGWRVSHVDEFQKLADRFNALRSGRMPPGNKRPTELWQALMHDRGVLMGTSPDPSDAIEKIRAALSPAQRRRYDVALNRVPGTDPDKPDTRLGAQVLPLPPDGIPREPGFYKVRWSGTVTTGAESRRVRMTYVVFLPKGYTPDGGPYPTLVFMHGSGEGGVDGNGLFAGDLGPAADLHRQPGSELTNTFPMILVCPQCPPRGERWDQEPTLRSALACLDDAQKKLRIDPDRLYVTGLSMGGKGTWLLAGLDPDRFAALCPISSSTLDLPLARRLRYDSVWAINGSEDIEDGPDHETAMVKAAHEAGGDAELTLLPGRGHDVWNDYYNDPDFYKWFLKHRRTTPDERHRRDLLATQFAAATRPATGPATVPATTAPVAVGR